MQLILQNARLATENILELEFRGSTPLPSFRAGQYVNFHLHDGEGRFRRSYSLGSTPTSDRWQFYVALVTGGRGSTQLLQLSTGDAVTVDPPMGIFTLREPPRGRLVLVATSTGIVPFRSMREQLEQLLIEGHQISLLHGVRSSKDLLFRDDWYHLLTAYEGFEYVPCLSRPSSQQECQRFGAIHGRVQLGLQRLPLISAQNTYFLCGNPDMVEQTEQLLMKAGIGLDQILVEAFESLE